MSKKRKIYILLTRLYDNGSKVIGILTNSYYTQAFAVALTTSKKGSYKIFAPKAEIFSNPSPREAPPIF